MGFIKNNLKREKMNYVIGKKKLKSTRCFFVNPTLKEPKNIIMIISKFLSTNYETKFAAGIEKFQNVILHSKSKL